MYAKKRNWTATLKPETGFYNVMQSIQKQVTFIMGPLAKVWHSIDQANQDDGSTIELSLETTLELLENTVVLVGQCYNSCSYET